MLPSSPTAISPTPTTKGTGTATMTSLMPTMHSSDLNCTSNHPGNCNSAFVNGNSSTGTYSSTITPTISVKAPDTTNSTKVNRRSNKPIMEKRRRARINNCLNELKGILLETMKKDPARHSKLEKADILELTVAHLRTTHARNSTAPVINGQFKYREGFSQCIAEVGRFLSKLKLDTAKAELSNRLLRHLAESLEGSTVSLSLVPPREFMFMVPNGNTGATGLSPLLSPDTSEYTLSPSSASWSSSSSSVSSSSRYEPYMTTSSSNNGLSYQYFSRYRQQHEFICDQSMQGHYVENVPLSLVTKGQHALDSDSGLGCWRPW